MKSKFTKSLHAIVALSLLLALRTVPASAATTNITGGTNGASCNSGGYFTPSSVTINSGDTVTISVPSNDPYAGGMEVLGFPQGNFDIARGGSFTTNPITANVSYHGTWPNDPACQKGSGTITVSAPVSPPPSSPPSSGGSSGSTSGSSSGGTTKSTSATSSTKSTLNSPTTSSTQPTTTTPTPATTSTPTTAPIITPKSQPTKTSQPNKVATVTMAKNPALKNAATIGGGGLAVIAIGLFIAWRLLARHRLRVPAVQPVTTTPAPTQPVIPTESPSQPVVQNAPDAPTNQNTAVEQSDDPK